MVGTAKGCFGFLFLLDQFRNILAVAFARDFPEEGLELGRSFGGVKGAHPFDIGAFTLFDLAFPLAEGAFQQGARQRTQQTIGTAGSLVADLQSKAHHGQTFFRVKRPGKNHVTFHIYPHFCTNLGAFCFFLFYYNACARRTQHLVKNPLLTRKILYDIIKITIFVKGR